MVFLILGLILIVVGVVVHYLVPDALAQRVGSLLVVVGGILVLVFLVLLILDAGDADVHDGVIHAFVSGRRWS